MPLSTGLQAWITAIGNALNTYATSMQMAAWSQATATTNATNLATAITNANNALTAFNSQQGNP